MKRAGKLWSEIVSWANLRDAARKARRRKRSREDVARFESTLEWQLLRLRDELISGEYRPGPYRTFIVREKVERLISAAPYRDRVVHHALMNVVGPVLERGLVARTFANREGYGSHRAWHLVKNWARHYRYCLRLDISKYFPSIDHEIVKAQLRRKIKCGPTLDLLDTIIDASNAQEQIQAWFPGDDLLTPLSRRKGLPIGNLTSQYLANFYLDEVDHLIMDRLGFGNYARYMDDMTIFDDSRERLDDLRIRIETELESLRLRAHVRKTRIVPSRAGIPFVGYVAYPERSRIDGGNVRRMRRKIPRLREDFAAGRIDAPTIVASVRSWAAHARHADTTRLRKSVMRFPETARMPMLAGTRLNIFVPSS